MTIDELTTAMAEEVRRSVVEQGGDINEAQSVLGWMSPLVSIFFILLAIIFMAWPIFLIFFLGRDKIKDDVQGWHDGTSDPQGWSSG